MATEADRGGGLEFRLPARPLHDQHAAVVVTQGLEPAEELRQRRDGPHDERVEAAGVAGGAAPFGDEHLGGDRMHREVQPGLGHDLRDGTRPLADAVAQFDVQVGPEDRQQHARHAAPGADVEHPLAAGEVWHDRRGVPHVPRHESVDIRVPREVEPLVP